MRQELDEEQVRAGVVLNIQGPQGRQSTCDPSGAIGSATPKHRPSSAEVRGQRGADGIPLRRRCPLPAPALALLLTKSGKEAPCANMLKVATCWNTKQPKRPPPPSESLPQVPGCQACSLPKPCPSPCKLPATDGTCGCDSATTCMATCAIRDREARPLCADQLGLTRLSRQQLRSR